MLVACLLCCWTRPVGLGQLESCRTRHHSTTTSGSMLPPGLLPLVTRPFRIHKPRAPALDLRSTSLFLQVPWHHHSRYSLFLVKSPSFCPAEAAVPSSCRLSSCLRHFHCTALRTTGSAVLPRGIRLTSKPNAVVRTTDYYKSHLLGDCAFSSLSRNSTDFHGIDLVGRYLHPPLITRLLHRSLHKSGRTTARVPVPGTTE